MGGLMLSKLRAALGWVSRRRGRHTAAFVDEEPDTLAPCTVYVVGEDGHRWFAAFDCPCGCGETIKLSLIPGDRPGWRLRDHWDGTASLAPSVWRKVGCKSHFWLRKGKVEWC
ncbi:hypothetical protein H0176_16910 [Methylorubrum populi]|uniref:DUF6527 family protein n=1 Tax=Methylorubrum rhodesianum TaxID=29427 RepID=A0ABU9ZHM1_9HYPH|nr:DUF6527 family protein [Methylorubrum rhodesianum]MBK3405300.1 hypothetical protein [Methylorubrum rhodesianum]MBY0141948.1 hypothetical protein [Methylorubrum populi]